MSRAKSYNDIQFLYAKSTKQKTAKKNTSRVKRIHYGDLRKLSNEYANLYLIDCLNHIDRHRSLVLQHFLPTPAPSVLDCMQMEKNRMNQFPSRSEISLFSI